ncbi:MAG: FeoB-associated Cys-rich membrane protein [Bacillota bacterium]
MGNIIVIAILSVMFSLIIRKIYKDHKNGAVCSSACTACPIVSTCNKDLGTLKQEMRHELHK